MQHFLDFVTGPLVTVIIGGVATPAVLKILKKLDALLEKVAPGVAHTADTAIQFLADLAKSPMFAGLAAKGKLEAKHVLDELKKTRLADAATKAYGVFHYELGVVLDSLTPSQKVDIISMVRGLMTKVGVDVTDQEVIDALKSAEADFEVFKKTVVPAVKQHDSALATWGAQQQPAQPAQ